MGGESEEDCDYNDGDSVNDPLECACNKIYAPVTCENGESFSNICEAKCRGHSKKTCKRDKKTNNKKNCTFSKKDVRPQLCSLAEPSKKCRVFTNPSEAECSKKYQVENCQDLGSLAFQNKKLVKSVGNLCGKHLVAKRKYETEAG